MLEYEAGLATCPRLGLDKFNPCLNMRLGLLLVLG